MRYCLLLALIYCALSVSASPQLTAQQLRDKALASDRGWDIVESLTTEVGPRLAGTPADKKAVEWAQRLLQNSSFDKVWLEPVEFPIWQRYHERARVLAPFPQPLTITALGYSGSTDGEITAPVVAFDHLEALQKASPQTVAGKIVFVNQPMYRHRQGFGYRDVVPLRYDAGPAAKEKGALAVLIRSLGTHTHRFAHTGVSTRSDDPLPAAALSPPDADQLQRIVDRGKPVVIGLDINVSTTPGGRSSNVIAQINGRDKPEQIVLIGAHLDSWDLGTGAIDDGAGVAITAAAAELIGQLPQRPRRSIRLVLFANEEQGLWGAKAYAKKHSESLSQHRFASESDFGAGLIWRFDAADQVLLDAAMPVLKRLGIARGPAATSGGPDITPLQNAGVPIFRLMQNGTDYFDTHHTADDTLDRINPLKLRQNVAAWAVVTWLAAELDTIGQ